ncbi:zinc-dependent alcohol dehydrogenase [Pseudonocardia sp. GCM10023141]|uniref:zinc-dependent alcohol dehydrogenase n=1 Tax=Pseudonocardia sp. GCM10023141 TaxID=3252653 RepID=UPI0036100E3C
MSARMRAAVWDGAGLRCTTVPVPEVAEGWTLVRVSHVGLCGTDLAIVGGWHPRAAPPLVLGHEFSGAVAHPGGRFAAGTPVVVEPLLTCGACWACRHGAAHVCAHLGLLGIDAPGALAELVAVPEDRLHPVADTVAPATAAWVEPLAVAVHAVAAAPPAPGDVVAVFGGGPIGVLTALVARHEGAGSVLVHEPNAARAAVVADLGFAVETDPDAFAVRIAAATGGEGAAVVFEAAGHPAAAAMLAAVGRVHATLVVVGVHKQPAAVDLQRLTFAEQRLVGVRVYTSEDFRRAVGLVVTGALPLDRLPTTVLPLRRAAAAVDAARSGTDALKVVVTP